MDCVEHTWKHHIWINEGILSNGEQSPMNNCPPHEGHQLTPKNGIIQVVKHAFVGGIIYKQGVANMSVQINK
jgi:hypothetical protein